MAGCPNYHLALFLSPTRIVSFSQFAINLRKNHSMKLLIEGPSILIPSNYTKSITISGGTEKDTRLR